MADTSNNPDRPTRPLHEAVRLTANHLEATPLEAVAEFHDAYEALDLELKKWA